MLTPRKFNSSIGTFKSTIDYKTLIPVRVVDIILDESHPEYEKYAKTRAIGAIKYRFLDKIVNEDEPEKLPVAFPLNQTIKTFPLKNEIVLLQLATSPEAITSKDSEVVTYYSSIVNVWNDINHNASPDSDSTSNTVDLGYEFKENSELKPLHPFNGDTIIEGRHGQSIRFAGARSFKNTISTSDNDSKPFIILSNGHEKSSGDEFYVEDINKDKSSIYITSDHTVPLDQSRDKYASAKERPTLAKSYKGSQIILKSGRLYFDAKEEDILFSSKGVFGVTSEAVHLDGKQYVGLDATKIYLGESAMRFELQPVILGNQLELFLLTLLSSLQRVSNVLTNAKVVDGKPIPLVNKEGPVLKADIKGLLNQINPNGNSVLKSTKVYTE